MSRSHGCFPFVFVVFVLVVGALAYWAGERRVLAPSAPEATADHQWVEHAADVVSAVRALARLETVAYHMERVETVKAEQRRFWGMFKTSDSILLIAAGDVTAGIDLSGLRARDVEIGAAGNNARLILPHPIILSAHLDNERTYVYSRDTDLLAKAEVDIEARARRDAEAGIRQAALDAGILQHARSNAAHTLRALVSSLGYSEVEILFRDAGDGGTPRQ